MMAIILWMPATVVILQARRRTATATTGGIPVAGAATMAPHGRVWPCNETHGEEIMRITSEQVRQELKVVWPALEYIWIFDADWWKPSQAQMQTLIDTSRLKDTKFIPQLFDCDNFASQFMSEVNRKRYFSHMATPFPEEQQVQAAVFCCAGQMFRGVGKNHVCNLAMLREGIFIVDMIPGEQHMWPADAQQDDIYFVTSV
jgi:hypothetical protein